MARSGNGAGTEWEQPHRNNKNNKTMKIFKLHRVFDARQAAAENVLAAILHIAYAFI